MRRYIPNYELYTALEQILSKQNPELLEIYKQIILYRTAADFKGSGHIEQMLQWPVRIVLTFINLIVSPAACTIFIFSLYGRLPESVSMAAVVSLVGFTVYEAFHFSRLAAKFSTCRPYLIVDELFVRKILVVQRISPKPIKAAK